MTDKAVESTTNLLAILADHPVLFTFVLITFIISIALIFITPKILKHLQVMGRHAIDFSPIQSELKEVFKRIDKLETSMCNFNKDAGLDMAELKVIIKNYDTDVKRHDNMFMSLARVVHSMAMFDVTLSLYDRLLSAFEFFWLGGNHGSEIKFVSEVLDVYPDGFRLWWQIVADRTRNGQDPSTAPEAVRELFNSIVKYARLKNKLTIAADAAGAWSYSA